MSKSLILIIFILSTECILGQIEKNDTLKIPDTLNTIEKQVPMLYLKSLINQSVLKNNAFTQHSNKLIELYLLGATKEDFNLGFSDDELFAYLKNKKTLQMILQKKYDESWWYRVKGIDELLGIPSEVFFLLKLAFLLAI